MRIFTIAVLTMTVSACSSPTSPSVAYVQGFWKGEWAASTCTVTGSVATSICINPRGTFNLRLTQTGQSARAFAYICGSETNSLTGTVAAEGTVKLSGEDVVPSYSPIKVSLDMTVTVNSMTGSFDCTLQLGGTAGAAVMTGSLNNVTLTSRDPNVPF
jgi:hypothetical protein